MKSKKEWEKLWDTAPVNKFLKFGALDAEELRREGVPVTVDWARCMYLLEKYSGGGYLSAAVHVTSFWRAVRCRWNIPYGEEIGNLFFDQLLYTFHGNRDVQTLLARIARIIGSDEISPESELGMIFEVINERTGVEYKTARPTKNTLDRLTENIPESQKEGKMFSYRKPLKAFDTSIKGRTKEIICSDEHFGQGMDFDAFKQSGKWIHIQDNLISKGDFEIFFREIKYAPFTVTPQVHAVRGTLLIMATGELRILLENGQPYSGFASLKIENGKLLYDDGLNEAEKNHTYKSSCAIA